MGEVYDVARLTEVTATLFATAGLTAAAATTVAELLVEGDLLGHDTHGLALASRYLEELRTGGMNPDPTPETRTDRGAVVTWDGGWRSGVWLTAQAVDLAADRAGEFGIGAVAIARSHHIACLQAYLRRATDRGFLVAISCSDPAGATVAPFGGLDPVFQPDPIAVGIPTGSAPVLVDMSTSITSNAAVLRAATEGRRLPGPWVQTADGVVTDDPAAFTAGGTILPAGGADHGHKGTSLALVVEATTQGLSGYGRVGAESRWGASVLVQAWDPTFFAGAETLHEQTDHLVAAVRGSRVRPGDPAPRVPGENALRRRAEALRDGLTLRSEVLESLRDEARKAGVVFPSPR